jgi:hypothetical protein
LHLGGEEGSKIDITLFHFISVQNFDGIKNWNGMNQSGNSKYFFKSVDKFLPTDALRACVLALLARVALRCVALRCVALLPAV